MSELHQKLIFDKFSKSFIFSDLNTKDIYENYRNSDNEIEWYIFFLLIKIKFKLIRWKINLKDDSEKDFIERVKRIIIKFKEESQNSENDTCIVIITGKNFMAQLFSYVTNTENYLQSKRNTKKNYFFLLTMSLYVSINFFLIMKIITFF